GNGNGAALENWLANVAASDVCSEVEITNDFEGLSDGCGTTGSVTVTWTATDECENTEITTATFTITDNSKPVFTVIPEDLTVECDGNGNGAALENWLANVAASDVCSEVEITNDFEGLSDGCGTTGSVTVTWTATDECQNIEITTATFTIVDNTNPVFTVVPENLTVECDGNGNTAAMVAWLMSATATDICGEVNVSYDYESLTNECGATGSTTATWTATDECGNFVSTSAIFTIVDTQAPTFTVYPMNLVVECDGNGNGAELENWLTNAAAIDNCGGVTLTNNFEGLLELCGTTGYATVTWTATDDCGNYTTATASFTIFDYTAPVFTYVPEDMTRECSGIPAVGTPVATDICSDIVTIVYNGQTRVDGDCPNSYTLTRTWTATDDCGNSASASQVITVEDTKAPEFSVLAADLTVECDGTGNTSALEAWLASNGGAIATDNCGEISWSNNFSSLSDGCGTTGSATVLFTVTDDCGNFKTTSATFTIIDSSAPVFTMLPQNLSVECDGNGNTAALESWLADVEADDACSEVTITNNFQSLSNLCGATGAATVVWTATDECGNFVTTSAVFTIVDTQAPELTCPQNITVNAEAGLCGANVQIPIPDTDDACGGVSLVNDYNGTAIGSDFYEIGTTIITWTATDPCGNSTSCQMSVTVVDNIDPQIVCPESISVMNDPGVCEAMVTVPQPEVSDNCGINSIVNNFNGTGNASGIYPVGITTVIWTVTDLYGNTAECSMTVTVTDNELPEIICPENVSVSTDASICEANVTIPQPEVSDNCGIASLINSYNGTNNASGVYPVGTTTINWIVTDIHGNTAECSMTVTVEDNENPVISCPENIAVNTDPGVCEANVTIPQPEVSDNCGIESLVNTYNGTDNASGIYPAGVTEITWTVTDIHGNQAECTMTVTVTDNENPVIECPENIAVNADPGVCEASVTIPLPEVSDNCGVESVVNSFNGTNDASGVYPVGTTTVIWTVTDIHGLTAECEMTVTVTDSEAPSIECPEDIIVVAGVDCNALVEIPVPVVSDNCGIENLVNSINNTGNASGIYPVGVTEITWTVTDLHGNTANCSLTVTVTAGPTAIDDNTVTDLNVPVAVAVLENDTDCDNNIDPSTVTVTSNPSNGFTMVDPQNGNILYTPNEGFDGTDTFFYSVCDLSGLCDEAQVTVVIEGGFTPTYLIAEDDTDTTLVNIPKLIINLSNDIVPEGITARIEILTQPSNGTIELHEDMTVTYTPSVGFDGTDEFTYILYDADQVAISDTAKSTIVIVPDSGREEVVIYNGFTPNSDGRNDSWVIDGIEEYPDNEILLFNRWGDQIRYFENYDNTTVVWDGTNKQGKELPDGTYYYIIKLRTINKIFTGWVIIHGN
ncbi:MAG: HYR domain-containing protein, partial [Lentimicrobium sp.]|nr:HYR domain-containing protein [Lentimicrobium sp.]